MQPSPRHVVCPRSSLVFRSRRLRCTRCAMLSSQGDSLFRKALRDLPSTLREALVAAELDDPVVLRSFPMYDAVKLGICEGGKRAHVRVDYAVFSSMRRSLLWTMTLLCATVRRWSLAMRPLLRLTTPRT